MKKKMRIVPFILSFAIALSGVNGFALQPAASNAQPDSCEETFQSCCCNPAPSPMSCCDEEPAQPAKAATYNEGACGCQFAPLNQPVPAEPASAQTQSIESLNTLLFHSGGFVYVFGESFYIENTPIHAPSPIALYQCVQTIQLRN